MVSIAEKDRRRSDFLRALYRATDGTPKTKRIDFRTIGSELGLAADEAEEAARWLTDRGLAEWLAIGGMIGITPLGVDEVENEERAQEASSVEISLAG